MIARTDHGGSIATRLTLATPTKSRHCLYSTLLNPTVSMQHSVSGWILRVKKLCQTMSDRSRRWSDILSGLLKIYNYVFGSALLFSFYMLMQLQCILCGIYLDCLW